MTPTAAYDTDLKEATEAILQSLEHDVFHTVAKELRGTQFLEIKENRDGTKSLRVDGRNRKGFTVTLTESGYALSDGPTVRLREGRGGIYDRIWKALTQCASDKAETHLRMDLGLMRHNLRQTPARARRAMDATDVREALERTGRAICATLGNGWPRSPAAVGNAMLQQLLVKEIYELTLKAAGSNASLEHYNLVAANPEAMTQAFAKIPNATLLWAGARKNAQPRNATAESILDEAEQDFRRESQGKDSDRLWKMYQKIPNSALNATGRAEAHNAVRLAECSLAAGTVPTATAVKTIMTDPELIWRTAPDMVSEYIAESRRALCSQSQTQSRLAREFLAKADKTGSAGNQKATGHGPSNGARATGRRQQTPEAPDNGEGEAWKTLRTKAEAAVNGNEWTEITRALEGAVQIQTGPHGLTIQAWDEDRPFLTITTGPAGMLEVTEAPPWPAPWYLCQNNVKERRPRPGEPTTHGQPRAAAERMLQKQIQEKAGIDIPQRMASSILTTLERETAEPPPWSRHHVTGRTAAFLEQALDPSLLQALEQTARPVTLQRYNNAVALRAIRQELEATNPGVAPWFTAPAGTDYLPILKQPLKHPGQAVQALRETLAQQGVPDRLWTLISKQKPETAAVLAAAMGTEKLTGALRALELSHSRPAPEAVLMVMEALTSPTWRNRSQGRQHRQLDQVNTLLFKQSEMTGREAQANLAEEAADAHDYASGRQREGRDVTATTWGGLMKAVREWEAEQTETNNAATQWRGRMTDSGWKMRVWNDVTGALTLAGGMRAEPLLDEKTLHEEGAKMAHCVTNWADTCASGETRVYVVTGPGLARATAVINRHGSCWTAGQTRLRKNREPAPPHIAATREIAATANRDQKATESWTERAG